MRLKAKTAVSFFTAVFLSFTGTLIPSGAASAQSSDTANLVVGKTIGDPSGRGYYTNRFQVDGGIGFCADAPLATPPEGEMVKDEKTAQEKGAGIGVIWNTAHDAEWLKSHGFEGKTPENDDHLFWVVHMAISDYVNNNSIGGSGSFHGADIKDLVSKARSGIIAKGSMWKKGGTLAAFGTPPPTEGGSNDEWRYSTQSDTIDFAVSGDQKIENAKAKLHAPPSLSNPEKWQYLILDRDFDPKAEAGNSGWKAFPEKFSAGYQDFRIELKNNQWIGFRTKDGEPEERIAVDIEGAATLGKQSDPPPPSVTSWKSPKKPSQRIIKIESGGSTNLDPSFRPGVGETDGLAYALSNSGLDFSINSLTPDLRIEGGNGERNLVDVIPDPNAHRERKVMPADKVWIESKDSSAPDGPYLVYGFLGYMPSIVPKIGELVGLSKPVDLTKAQSSDYRDTNMVRLKGWSGYGIADHDNNPLPFGIPVAFSIASIYKGEDKAAVIPSVWGEGKVKCNGSEACSGTGGFSLLGVGKAIVRLLLGGFFDDNAAVQGINTVGTAVNTLRLQGEVCNLEGKDYVDVNRKVACPVFNLANPVVEGGKGYKKALKEAEDTLADYKAKHPEATEANDSFYAITSRRISELKSKVTAGEAEVAKIEAALAASPADNGKGGGVVIPWTKYINLDGGDSASGDGMDLSNWPTGVYTWNWWALYCPFWLKEAIKGMAPWMAFVLPLPLQFKDVNDKMNKFVFMGWHERERFLHVRNMAVDLRSSVEDAYDAKSRVQDDLSEGGMETSSNANEPIPSLQMNNPGWNTSPNNDTDRFLHLEPGMPVADTVTMTVGDSDTDGIPGTESDWLHDMDHQGQGLEEKSNRIRLTLDGYMYQITDRQAALDAVNKVFNNGPKYGEDAFYINADRLDTFWVRDRNNRTELRRLDQAIQKLISRDGEVPGVRLVATASFTTQEEGHFLVTSTDDPNAKARWVPEPGVDLNNLPEGAYTFGWEINNYRQRITEQTGANPNNNYPVRSPRPEFQGGVFEGFFQRDQNLYIGAMNLGVASDAEAAQDAHKGTIDRITPMGEAVQSCHDGNDCTHIEPGVPLRDTLKVELKDGNGDGKVDERDWFHTTREILNDRPRVPGDPGYDPNNPSTYGLGNYVDYGLGERHLPGPADRIPLTVKGYAYAVDADYAQQLRDSYGKPGAVTEIPADKGVLVATGSQSINQPGSWTWSTSDADKPDAKWTLEQGVDIEKLSGKTIVYRYEIRNKDQRDAYQHTGVLMKNEYPLKNDAVEAFGAPEQDTVIKQRAVITSRVGSLEAGRGDKVTETVTISPDNASSQWPAGTQVKLKGTVFLVKDANAPINKPEPNKNGIIEIPDEYKQNVVHGPVEIMADHWGDYQSEFTIPVDAKEGYRYVWVWEAEIPQDSKLAWTQQWMSDNWAAVSETVRVTVSQTEFATKAVESRPTDVTNHTLFYKDEVTFRNEDAAKLDIQLWKQGVGASEDTLVETYSMPVTGSREIQTVSSREFAVTYDPAKPNEKWYFLATLYNGAGLAVGQHDRRMPEESFTSPTTPSCRLKTRASGKEPGTVMPSVPLNEDGTVTAKDLILVGDCPSMTKLEVQVFKQVGENANDDVAVTDRTPVSFVKTEQGNYEVVGSVTFRPDENPTTVYYFVATGYNNQGGKVFQDAPREFDESFTRQPDVCEVSTKTARDVAISTDGSITIRDEALVKCPIAEEITFDLYVQDQNSDDHTKDKKVGTVGPVKIQQDTAKNGAVTVISPELKVENVAQYFPDSERDAIFYWREAIWTRKSVTTAITYPSTTVVTTVPVTGVPSVEVKYPNGTATLIKYGNPRVPNETLAVPRESALRCNISTKTPSSVVEIDDTGRASLTDVALVDCPQAERVEFELWKRSPVASAPVSSDKKVGITVDVPVDRGHKRPDGVIEVTSPSIDVEEGGEYYWRERALGAKGSAGPNVPVRFERPVLHYGLPRLPNETVRVRDYVCLITTQVPAEQVTLGPDGKAVLSDVAKISCPRADSISFTLYKSGKGGVDTDEKIGTTPSVKINGRGTVPSEGIEVTGPGHYYWRETALDAEGRILHVGAPRAKGESVLVEGPTCQIRTTARPADQTLSDDVKFVPLVDTAHINCPEATTVGFELWKQGETPELDYRVGVVNSIPINGRTDVDSLPLVVSEAGPYYWREIAYDATGKEIHRGAPRLPNETVTVVYRPKLATTGANVLWVALGGLLLLVIGGCFIVVRRRKD